MPSDIYIRALEPNETDLHRQVRIRALRDAPDSFGSTLEQEDAQPPVYWKNQTGLVSGSGRNVMFLACQGDEILGMTYGLRDRNRRDGARVGGMWVDASARRRGVGRQLLTAVFDWARDCALRHIGLWAPAHGVAAIGLYCNMGFGETGTRGSMRPGSDLEILEMERDL